MKGRAAFGRPAAWLLLATVLAFGCQGSGSDIGPTLDDQPDVSSKVLVLDDGNAGVTGAVVDVDAEGARAVTGRSGRCDLLADPRGRRLVQVSAAAASATASDRLGSLTFRAELPSRDLPFAVHLPDTAPSAIANIALGTALPATVLDDTAQSGARLSLPAGTVAAAGPATGAVALRLGRLAIAHLPGELPVAAGGPLLFGRGFYVDPPELTLSSAATLEVPDDLLLPGAATASLFHLDVTTGEWTELGTTATSAGGRLSQPAAVTAGGLYVYAVAAPALATVRGRVVDTVARALPDVLVRVDAGKARTGNDGRFEFPAVAATLADGSARAVAVELHGGGDFRPVTRTATTVALTGGAVADLGDLLLDAEVIGNVRVQCVKRGRAEPARRLFMSAIDGATLVTALLDDRGQCLLEEISDGYFGFNSGHPIDREKVFLAQGITFLSTGRRWLDMSVFFRDQFWYIGARSTRALVFDDPGGGPVRGAAVVRGSADGTGFSGLTEDGGVVFVDRAFDGRATASLRTEREGRTIVSAFTIERPNGEHLELPLRRAQRTPGGAFDRHGVVAGFLTGFSPLREQRLRSTRSLEFDEWFETVMLGQPLQSALPIKSGTAVPAGSYRAGIGVPHGNVAVAEGTTTGGAFTLQSLGIATGVTAEQGAVTPLDLPLVHPAGSPFVAREGLLGLDPAFTPAGMVFDLGLRLPSGLVVDVARAIGGNLAAAGPDAVLTLPLLAGGLAGGTWLCALSASTLVGGAGSAQRLLLELDGGPGVARQFLPLPTLLAPLHGATVAATGFAVDYALPPGCQYATIELLNAGNDQHYWYVVVPPDLTTFSFWRLPPEAQTPLVAGLSYTLTLTAYRDDGSVLVTSDDPYRDLTTYWMSIGAAERGVRATASRTITVTAN